MFYCYLHNWISDEKPCPSPICSPTITVTSSGTNSIDLHQDDEKEPASIPETPWRDAAKQNMKLEKQLKNYKDLIEQLKDPLVWADEMLTARDEMNAKVHCSPVRLSEITLRIKAARKALEEVAG